MATAGAKEQSLARRVKVVSQFEFEALDGLLSNGLTCLMSALHRTINLIVALTLVVLGCGGFIYFYFIDPTWPRWILIAAIIVGAAGLYWLWDEHVSVGEHSRN
jgi:protein-S-isoprenylcysteine O-methyltransferase Ste14